MRSRHVSRRSVYRDERGMSLVFVGLGFMGFIAATMLAIDVGMLMTARAQAQNSADAGALAGAVALAFDNFDDRTPEGPAVTNAIGRAEQNEVMAQTVSVLPEDVTFPTDETGAPNRIRVTVHRTAARSNPLGLFIAPMFGTDTADITATATAEVSAANGMTCVKPFTIPDKWVENQTAPWDGDDTFDAFDSKGVPLSNADLYIPAAGADGVANPDYTGYNQESNRGQRLTIRAGTGNNITVSFYFSIAIAGITGGSEYEWNIANCNQHVMRWGELLLQEPGAMQGPTSQGLVDLIAKDPSARWDADCNCVKDSGVEGPQSPRVFPIPLYDPIYYDSGKRNGRFADLKVANWIGFFLEEMRGNEAYGRIIPIAGIRSGNWQAPQNLFPKVIRLVQ